MRNQIILSIAIVFLAGCASKVVVPEKPAPPAGKANAAWATVLQQFVDAKGRVDFVGLSKNKKDLDTYVAYVTLVSPKNHPEKFPSPNSKLAFYINAYNALSMYNVIHFEIPEDNDSFFKRYKFFYLTKYKIGGEYMSLYDLENDFVRSFKDPRIHVALNCMAISCPRLPQTPFTPEGLEQELENHAKEFFNEERNVRVDNEKKTVWLSEILDFFPDDFLEKAPSLIAYVNKYHKNKIPEDYEVEFTDYDWTINGQTKKVKDN